MSMRYIFAVVLIFILSASGWWVLGSISEFRSYYTSSSLGRSVQGLWGQPIVQKAPSLSVKIPGTSRLRAVLPSHNDIQANIRLEQRRKGLIWYPTYVVDFEASYTLFNEEAVAQNVRLHVPLPSADATYDRFQFWLDDQLQVTEFNAAEGINEIIELAPQQTRSFKIAYRTRGLYQWQYDLASSQGRVRALTMDVKTNFSAVDFGEGSLAPMQTELGKDRARLRWQAQDLITQQSVSVIMPERLNPGPLSARMSFFAPVCLLFFYLLITAISIMRRIAIHPMHYLFVSGGFFAFHLLFAYLVDIINVHLAFTITSMVSVALVVSYLKAALKKAFPWKIAALGQLFYLVLFSYSFFIKGMTGLTVTIGSILTLAMIMRMTADLDWRTVFNKAEKIPPATAPQ